MCCDVLRCQACLVRAGINASPIHAKRHRWMRVSHSEHTLPVAGICAAQEFNPPQRMLIARFGFKLCLERTTLAQETAKQSVDVTLRRPMLDQSASLDCFVDHGVLAIAARLECIERRPEKRLDERVGPTAPRKMRDDGLHPSVAPEGAVGKIDQCAVRVGHYVGQAATRCNFSHDAGRLGELHGERRGLLHSKRMPLSIRWPRKKSLAAMRRPPAGCNS